jgi:hypothetical protein
VSDWASPETAPARNSSNYIRLFARLFAVLTMQRYGGFQHIPIFFEKNIQGCDDTKTVLRQIRLNALKSVAKHMKTQ